MGELFQFKACQSYIIMFQAFTKATPNAILRPSSTLAYMALQHVIMEDDVWRMIKHILCKQAPQFGGKADDTISSTP